MSVPLLSLGCRKVTGRSWAPILGGSFKTRYPFCFITSMAFDTFVTYRMGIRPPPPSQQPGRKGNGGSSAPHLDADVVDSARRVFLKEARNGRPLAQWLQQLDFSVGELDELSGYPVVGEGLRGWNAPRDSGATAAEMGGCGVRYLGLADVCAQHVAIEHNGVLKRGHRDGHVVELAEAAERGHDSLHGQLGGREVRMLAVVSA